MRALADDIAHRVAAMPVHDAYLRQSGAWAAAA
jgi:hypothetical protein